MNQTSTNLYFNRFALPTLAKLKQQRMISGHFSLKVDSSSACMVSKFLFNGDWDFVIKLAVEQSLKFLNVTMTCVNSDIGDVVHSLHFHPSLEERDTWTCLPAYEKSFHFHLYSKGNSKLVLRDEPDSIAFLFIFLAGRYYKNRHGDLQRKLKPGPVLDYGLSAAIG